MIALALAITAIAVLLVLTDLRKGILAVVVVGLLQDVIRKLTPGAPTYFILWSMAIFSVVALRAWRLGALAPFRTLWLRRDLLQLLWSGLALLVAAQFVHSLLRWGPAVAVLGVVEYIVPLVAVLFGAGLARRPGGLPSFLRTYATVMVPAALTVYLSIWLSDAWPVLRDVGTFTGTQLIIFAQGTVIRPHSGILRTGEIASWHAANAAVFLVLIAQAAPSRRRSTFIGALIALLVGAIVFTGRRKMLMALTIFIALQVVASVAMRSRSGRRWVASLLIGLVLAILPAFLFRDQSLYATHGASVYASVEERSGTALALARSAFSRGGFFGLGLGVFAQGSRYAGVDLSSVVGGAGEAGVGKLILELGVPGLLLLSLISVVTARQAWRIFRSLRRRSDPRLGLLISFAAYLSGQLATFAVATQLFGDPFVLIVLGISIGCFVHLLSSAAAQQQPTARPAGVQPLNAALRHRPRGHARLPTL